MIELEPSAVHRGEEDLPWIDSGRGNEVKLLTAKISEGLWIVRTRFQPGTAVQTHRHTGQVYAYTMSGSWHYKESEYVNRQDRSFTNRPDRSTHFSFLKRTMRLPMFGFQISGRISILTKQVTLSRSLTPAQFSNGI